MEEWFLNRIQAFTGSLLEDEIEILNIRRENYNKLIQNNDEAVKYHHRKLRIIDVINSLAETVQFAQLSLIVNTKYRSSAEDLLKLPFFNYLQPQCFTNQFSLIPPPPHFSFNYPLRMEHCNSINQAITRHKVDGYYKLLSINKSQQLFVDLGIMAQADRSWRLKLNEELLGDKQNMEKQIDNIGIDLISLKIDEYSLQAQAAIRILNENQQIENRIYQIKFEEDKKQRKERAQEQFEKMINEQKEIISQKQEEGQAPKKRRRI
ncbi:MAG: hypothetical protein EZS28_014134 [Streblomastix strix]|uniref:Uncharacterized protein n=1 Tax=Streblomastix strix TaxID=222440 RepID=A0A5J4W651_9EUKA|nr:MAG: hypothetical protein EZS28_014134 [Streblomastix strix]